MTNGFATPVWRLVGAVRSVPGVLRFADDRVSFTTAEGVDFDTPTASVTDVKFPWYYFGGGMKVSVNGESYRFSFLKPNAGDDVPEHLLQDVEQASMRSRVADAVGILTVDVEAGGFARGRKAGKAWKAALASRA